MQMPAKPFLSTLSVRRATYQCPVRLCGHCISIHALREESDYMKNALYWWSIISIHALREESDTVKLRCKKADFAFLSTLSVRRATPCRPRTCSTTAFLSTLSVRRATTGFAKDNAEFREFLSTLSVRRATRTFRSRSCLHGISIHALREESDSKSV